MLIKITPGCTRIWLWAGSLLLSFSVTLAQNEYVSILDYQNLAVNRLVNIPAITYVDGDNSTYDANHQRFFFLAVGPDGSTTELYTIDVSSGAILYHPATGRVAGLQYDNTSDTLYALSFDGAGQAHFSWIEPATGVVHGISDLPSFTGYQESGFDRKDHWYICNGGGVLLIIDASSGKTLYNPSFPPGTRVTNLVFDNAANKTYAVCGSSSQQSFQIDSITLTSGALHPIMSLPPLSFPQFHANAIDESSGKYIFVCSDPVFTVPCSNDYLYVTDIRSGSILSSKVYPYAQDIASPFYENVISYSFDNQRGKLYALNWHPAPAIATITASSNPVCAGTAITFSANPGMNIGNFSYQWQVNGANVGADDPAYTDRDPATGDVIHCIITNNATTCGADRTDTSNSITVTVTPAPVSSVTIATATDTVCSADTVLFIATPSNGGPSPSYQWQINGIDQATNRDTLADFSLADGDVVSCILTGSQTCSLPVGSTNTLRMTVDPTPGLRMGNDTVIKPGQQVGLNPDITGTISSYQWSPPTGLDNPAIPGAIATPANTTTYQLTVVSDKGCSASGKVTIVVYSPFQMPNAFTPNGDGRNDVFRVPPSNPQKIMNFSIFSRWGECVFLTTDAGRGWDGAFHNHPQAAGAYVWKIEYEDILTHKPVVASGVVILVR